MHENSKLHEMKINYFIINLPRDVERRIFITNDMEKHNLNFSIIEAVDGRILSDEILRKSYDERKSIELFNRKMTPGEIGCALSHIKIFNKMLAENIPKAVILEDDAYIVDEKIEELIADLSDIYSEADPVVVLLNFVERYESNKNDITINEKYTLHDSYRSISAAAYFITKAAANIFCKNIFPVYVVADKWEYFQKEFFPVKMIIPNCIDLSEQSLFSTIDPLGNRRKKIKKKFNFKYYLIRNINTIMFAICKKPFMKIKRRKLP